MTDEYFMHTIFDAPYEEVKEFIDFYLEVHKPSVRLGKIIARVFERRGYYFKWWFEVMDDHPIDSILDEEPFTSQIDCVETAVTKPPSTEVRIIFTKGSWAQFYFKHLAYALWDYFSIGEGELQLPKIGDKPLFSSAIEYKRSEDIAEAELNTLWDRSIPTESKRGRSRYSNQQKLQALKEWDEIDTTKDSRMLYEYLEDKFGSKEGVLNVPESTFHSWRREMKKKGLYKHN